MSDKLNLLSFNVNYKQTLMDTVLSTAAAYIQENPEFKSHVRHCDQHTELKKLHEENTALLLALKISQRETQIHKNSATRWRIECERLLIENRDLTTKQIMKERVERTKQHQKAWAKDFDFSSSDEDE